MTHTYKINGMTCRGCLSKVKKVLSLVSGVHEVTVDLEKAEARITMERHIPTKQLQDALKDHPNYSLAEHVFQEEKGAPAIKNGTSWLSAYNPILVVFGYILGVTLLIEWVDGAFNLERWMTHFMGGFFLVFSFFKMLDLRGFADNYSTYDIVAKKWQGWAYIYAFIELILGIGFLTGRFPLLINAATFIIMVISMVGVLQAVMSKKKIRCACLGAVFNLPMSTITIIEDGLMILMSLGMILFMLF